MKNFQHHLSFSIFLQVLGILVNGILGMGLEMIGASILNLKNKKTQISLLKKFAFIVVSQILIDFILGNDAMMVDMIFLYLEKMSSVIFAMMKIFIGLLFILFFQKYFMLYCFRIISKNLTLPQLNSKTHIIFSPEQHSTKHTFCGRLLKRKKIVFLSIFYLP